MGCSVSQFVKYLETTDEQKNAQRFTIYNYFSTYLTQTKELSPVDIEQFYLTTLRYEHWQKNAFELAEHFQDLLLRFARTTSLSFDPEGLTHACDWQIINLISQKDQNQCLQRFLHRHYGPSTDVQYKILNLQDGRQATLIKTKERIRVNVFSASWFINKGELSPMNPVTQLTYDHNLNFVQQTGQFIELNPHTQFYFNHNEVFFGCHIRGYCMQKTSPVQFKTFSDIKEVYSAIKSLESHYINAGTDPEYQDLVRLIDKSTQMLLSRTPGAESLAEKALNQGQFGLQSVFPNDKYLQLLLSQLELAMMKKSIPIEKTWQWQDLKSINPSD